MKRILSLGAALLLLAAGFEAAWATGSVESKVQKGVELEYTSMWNVGEPQAAYFSKMAEDFTKETGIAVKIDNIGRKVIDQIRPRLIAGNPPDLADQGLYFVLRPAFLMGNEILATQLDDFFYKEKGPEGQARMMNLFSEPEVKLYDFQGHQYFFPYTDTTVGFFYDKNLFAKYNAKVPKTWTEFLALCKSLKDAGVTPLSQDGTENTYNIYYYQLLADRLVGPGALHTAAFDKTGAAWDNPGYLKAAQLVYQLSKSGLNYFQDGYEGSLWPAAQASWSMGKEAMMLMGTWLPSETAKTATAGFNYGYFSIPAVEGGKGKVTEMQSSLKGFVIPKAAKHPNEAMLFMKFISRKANADAYVTMTGNVSARLGTVYPDTLADVKPLVNAATGWILVMDGVSGDLPEWNDQYLLPNDDKLIFGEITPEQFVATMKKATIDYWASKR
jgi:ABC-type glycerol-3-phosphate transport system substrate-binding protein